MGARGFHHVSLRADVMIMAFLGYVQPVPRKPVLVRDLGPNLKGAEIPENRPWRGQNGVFWVANPSPHS